MPASPLSSRKLAFLVVDDEPTVRHLAAGLLKRAFPNATIDTCNDGHAALGLVNKHPPSLVITDLFMPGSDGLTLVSDIHLHHPALPVIVITSRGSEQAITKALRAGAASYVPKQRIGEELVDTVHWILAVGDKRARHEEIFDYQDRIERHYTLPNRSELIAPLVTELQQDLRRLGVCPEEDLIRFGVAMTECLMNAMIHGNLGLPGHLLSKGVHAFRELVEERLGKSPWKDRRVTVDVIADRMQATCTVRDEGDGFNPAELPDPTCEDAMERPHGRGLLLIRSFMNEVKYNAKGNEVTLIKRCPPKTSGEPCP